MSKPIKWGILGTGFIAHKFAEGLKFVPNASLHAIGSRNWDKATQFANEFQVPRSYGSYEELAKDPEVDVVYVATPHNLHCQNTIMCLESGKHVLCEKPFAVNGREVRQMITKAQEKNLFLMEALWSRFIPHIIKAKEWITTGAIGEVKFMKCDFGMNFPFDPNHRIYNRELIGGSLLDIGIYPVFLALYLLGKPLKISALASIGATLVDYNMSASFLYEGEKMAVLYSTIVAKTDITAEIHGTKGKIVFDEWWFTPVPVRLFGENGRETDKYTPGIGNGYNFEAEEVVQCLQNNLTQSEKMSWNHSLELIDILDEIRTQCMIYYPGHD